MSMTDRVLTVVEYLCLACLVAVAVFPGVAEHRMRVMGTPVGLGLGVLGWNCFLTRRVPFVRPLPISETASMSVGVACIAIGLFLLAWSGHFWLGLLRP
jgi:hypothetical protein